MIDDSVKELAQKIVDFWTPERRIKRNYATFGNNWPCEAKDPRAKKFCALGVLERFATTNPARLSLRDELTFRLKKIMPPYRGLISINDDVKDGQTIIYDALKDIAEGK